jgi:hypothetical protein
MAFRTSNVVPAVAYVTVRAAAAQLKLNIDAVITFLAGNNTSYDYLRGVYQTLERANNQFDSLKTTPGLADYAKVQENDPAYDVVAEFVTMQAAIAAAMSWMATNVPLNVTLKPVNQWGNGGGLIATEFSPAQTSTFRTVLAAVSNAIN